MSVAPVGEKPRFESIAFSPDGGLLASGGSDGGVVVWKTWNWTVRFRLRGHKENVLAVAFSPDGSVLASCARDGMVKLWPMKR